MKPGLPVYVSRVVSILLLAAAAVVYLCFLVFVIPSLVTIDAAYLILIDLSCKLFIVTTAWLISEYGMPRVGLPTCAQAWSITRSPEEQRQQSAWTASWIVAVVVAICLLPHVGVAKLALYGGWLPSVYLRWRGYQGWSIVTLAVWVTLVVGTLIVVPLLSSNLGVLEGG